MTNLLVVSDTHGNCRALEEVLKKQFQISEKHRPTPLVHLGDGIADVEKCEISKRFCPHIVKGNCDGFFYSQFYEEECFFELEGYKILIMHGHTRSVKYGINDAAVFAAKNGADLLLYGHTHSPVNYTIEKGYAIGDFVLEKELTVFNPGSLGQKASFGSVVLDGHGIICSHGSLI